RASGRFLAQPPRPDRRGPEPDPRRIEAVAERRAAGGDGLRPAANLDPARPPGRQDVVEHYRGAALAVDVGELPAPGEAVASDVDRVVLGVVAEAGRHHVGHAVLADGGGAAPASARPGTPARLR